MVRSQEGAGSTTSGEIKEPQPIGCRLIAEMVNSSCGTEPHLEKFIGHQPECESVQFKQSDKGVSINAAEQEAVPDPVVIFSHVTQDNAVSDRLQSTELALESFNIHEIDTALIEVLSEVKQANVTTVETDERSTDVKNEPQDQADLEGPVINLLGDEVENGTKTTSSLAPQTSHKDQSSPNPYHETSLDVNGDGMHFQETEVTSMDPKARDDHPGMISGTILEHLEEMCFKSEIQLQATEETETLEPPAKKRLRRRMGMCGLGDRKRKFPFDGQHCRQGLVGRQREEGAGKGNKGVQPLYNTVLENDGTTPMDCEGTTRPACKENEEVLKDKENNDATVKDEERTTGVAEKESRYALRNMSKCTALMNDEVTTDESPTENKDVQKKGILEENDGTVIMADKGTVKHKVLEHELNLLEDIPARVGQMLLRPITGEILNIIQDELLVAAATNDHEIENITCGDEPNSPGTEMANNGQDIEFKMKHEILSEKQYLCVDNKVDEDPGEIVVEAEVAQEVSSSSVCATLEMFEGAVIVIKEVQEIPTGLEESEMKIEQQWPPNMAANEEQCPPSMPANENPDPNRPELSDSTEKGLDPLFADNMDIAVIASIDIDNAKGHGENDQPIVSVSQTTVPAGKDNSNVIGISEPIAPPTGQENHIPHLLDQNICDTSMTPSVAKQQVCNPTLTPAADELPQETCVGLSVPSLLCSVTDSELHKIALSMELEDQPIPEGCDRQEDATELVRGLIRELSSLNRTVMAAQREMELLRRGKLPKAPNRHPCGPRPTEM